jgi:hypothetical protein
MPFLASKPAFFLSLEKCPWREGPARNSVTFYYAPHAGLWLSNWFGIDAYGRAVAVGFIQQSKSGHHVILS